MLLEFVALNTKPYSYELNIDPSTQRVNNWLQKASRLRTCLLPNPCSVLQSHCWNRCVVHLESLVMSIVRLTSSWTSSTALRCQVPAVAMSTIVNMCVLESWLYFFCWWLHVWLQLRHVGTLGQGAPNKCFAPKRPTCNCFYTLFFHHQSLDAQI